MRWNWIDRIVELVPRERLVAIKHVSLAEEHLHDHFPANGATRPLPIMPGCLIIEGMAQSAGILVGHAHGFRERVILAKISVATLEQDAEPGCTLRYTATVDRLDDLGASTKGRVELIRWEGLEAKAQTIGQIDLLFSHLGDTASGLAIPSHNFVFSEAFRTLLSTSGIEVPTS